MKFSIIGIFAAAIGVAQAGYVQNKVCPAATSIPYESGMATAYLQRVLYIDSTIYSFINQVSKLTKRDFSCLNDGTYGTSESDYAYWHNNATGVLATNIVFFDSATGTRVIQDCIDSRKLAAKIAYYATSNGVAMPQAVANAMSKLLAKGRFDMFTITGPSKSLSAEYIANLEATVKSRVPSFSMKGLTAIDQTKC